MAEVAFVLNNEGRRNILKLIYDGLLQTKANRISLDTNALMSCIGLDKLNTNIETKGIILFEVLKNVVEYASVMSRNLTLIFDCEVVEFVDGEKAIKQGQTVTAILAEESM